MMCWCMHWFAGLAESLSRPCVRWWLIHCHLSWHWSIDYLRLPLPLILTVFKVHCQGRLNCCLTVMIPHPNFKISRRTVWSWKANAQWWQWTIHHSFIAKLRLHCRVKCHSWVNLAIQFQWVSVFGPESAWLNLQLPSVGSQINSLHCRLTTNQVYWPTLVLRCADALQF